MTRRKITIAAAAAAALVAGPISLAGPVALAAESASAPADADHAREGRRLYLQYCAACHGREANGLGPVAPVLTPRPTDLTTLGRRHGTPLPKPMLGEFIDGRREIRAHGTTDMPVWGENLSDPLPASVNAAVRVRGQILLILDYLETVQAPKEAR